MPKKINYASLYTLRSDGRYMGYWRDKDGKRHAAYDKDPEVLHHKLELKEAPPVLTFSNMAELWEKETREQVTERTWKNYRPHYLDLVSSFGKRPCSEISAMDINADLLSAKAQDLSATVVNTRRVIWTGILNTAVVNGAIPFNPAISVRLPKGLHHGKRRAPTDAEIEIIIRSLDLPFGFFPYLLLFAGMRKGEGLALLKSDIDFDAKLIHVTKTLEYISNSAPRVKPPKTESGIRDIPIVAPLMEPLRSYVDSLHTLELFPAEPSNRVPKAKGYMSEHQYERLWKSYCEAAGLHDLTAHNLRHGTATLMFEYGVDVYTTQHLIGHSNVQTTIKLYTELREKQKAKSVKKFESGMAKRVKKVSKPDNKSDNK